MATWTRNRVTALYVAFLVLFGVFLIAWAVGILWWLSGFEGLHGGLSLVTEP